MDIISNQLTDLGIAVEVIPDRIVSDLADVAMIYAVPDVVPVVVARDVECHDSQANHEQQPQTCAQHFHDHGQDSPTSEHDLLQFTDSESHAVERSIEVAGTRDVVGL